MRLGYFRVSHACFPNTKGCQCIWALPLWSETVASACDRRTRAFSRRLISFVLSATAAGVAGPVLAAPPEVASAAGPEVAPAAGPVSRWALPAAHVAMRSAILGGSSAMERTLISQGSIEARAPSAPVSYAVAASPWRTSYEPAGDTPNVFGSVALAVSHTPLDAQWTRANAAHTSSAWTRAFPRLRADNREALLRQVNQYVNGHVRFTDDQRDYGQADRWAGANETLRRGRGDCEDYALTKMQLLAAMGFNRDDLYLVIVRDVVRQGDHAILVARLDDRFVVLDNLHDDLVESGDLPDYRPIMSYSSAGRWVHGYAAAPQRPIQVASYAGAAP